MLLHGITACHVCCCAGVCRFQALRSIVVCFLEAVPLLMSVVGLLFFFMFIFAVAGTELFSDIFHYGCVDDAGNVEASWADADEYGCGARQCPTVPTTPVDYTCVVSLCLARMRAIGAAY